jgi:hypothetical protein
MNNHRLFPKSPPIIIPQPIRQSFDGMDCDSDESFSTETETESFSEETESGSEIEEDMSTSE